MEKTIHYFENSGEENLEIIEVQTGTYLGEDDIFRYEDIYNRMEPEKKEELKKAN